MKVTIRRWLVDGGGGGGEALGACICPEGRQVHYYIQIGTGLLQAVVISCSLPL